MADGRNPVDAALDALAADLRPDKIALPGLATTSAEISTHIARVHPLPPPSPGDTSARAVKSRPPGAVKKTTRRTSPGPSSSRPRSAARSPAATSTSRAPCSPTGQPPTTATTAHGCCASRPTGTRATSSIFRRASTYSTPSDACRSTGDAPAGSVAAPDDSVQTHLRSVTAPDACLRCAEFGAGRPKTTTGKVRRFTLTGQQATRQVADATAV